MPAVDSRCSRASADATDPPKRATHEHVEDQVTRVLILKRGEHGVGVVDDLLACEQAVDRRAAQDPPARLLQSGTVLSAARGRREQGEAGSNRSEEVPPASSRIVGVPEPRR